MNTTQVLPRDASERLVAAISAVMLEMHVDKTISNTSIFIEVESLQAYNAQGQCLHVKLEPGPVDDGGQAAIGPVDCVPIDEHAEPEDFCDMCKPMWSECVSIAKHRDTSMPRTQRMPWRHRYAHNSMPRIMGGVPNTLFRHAKQIWKQLPKQIVEKEELKRLVSRRNYQRMPGRLRMQATRRLKNATASLHARLAKQARMEALQNGPASEEAPVRMAHSLDSEEAPASGEGAAAEIARMLGLNLECIQNGAAAEAAGELA